MEKNKILREQIESAAPEIKKILIEGSWSAVTRKTTEKYNFTNEQLMSLENEILFILLGMELAKNLSGNIISNVGLSEHVAIEISKQIYEKIIKPVELLLPGDIEKEAPTISSPNLPVLEPDFAKETIAVKQGEVPKEVPHVEITNPKPQITDNNQNPISKPQTAQIPVNEPPKFKYPGGADPYREPLN